MDSQKNMRLKISQTDIKQIKDDLTIIKDDVQTVKRLKEDNATMKRDLQQIKQKLDEQDVNRYLQQTVQLSSPPSGTHHAENMDRFSDTASTVSVASTGSEDERVKENVLRTKCMSEAIQRHIVEIMQNVPFDDIVDDILAKHIVTVQENERIREFQSGADKMRYLVRNVMCKDYATMRKFLDLINEYDPNLRSNILRTFKIRHQDGIPNAAFNTCTVCLMKERISIKVVGDQLFGRELISGDLFGDISASSSKGSSDSLWQRLVEELSSERPEYIMNVMKEVLQDGEGEPVSHYEDIIQNIDKDIKRHRRSFKCRCSGRRKRQFSPSSPSSVVRIAKRTPPYYERFALNQGTWSRSAGVRIRELRLQTTD